MAATHSPCPGSGERQRWRGGKGYDGHTGMILIEDYGLLMLLDRDTRRSPRTRVLAVITHTTVSPLFFIAYPQTRVPAPSVLGPYADATGAGPSTHT
jgi:hypothetical protein